MQYDINISDPGGQGVISDLRTILSLVQQIKMISKGLWGGGIGGLGGRGGIGSGTGLGSAGRGSTVLEGPIAAATPATKTARALRKDGFKGLRSQLGSQRILGGGAGGVGTTPWDDYTRAIPPFMRSNSNAMWTSSTILNDAFGFSGNRDFINFNNFSGRAVGPGGGGWTDPGHTFLNKGESNKSVLKTLRRGLNKGRYGTAHSLEAYKRAIVRKGLYSFTRKMLPSGVGRFASNIFASGKLGAMGGVAGLMGMLTAIDRADAGDNPEDQKALRFTTQQLMQITGTPESVRDGMNQTIHASAKEYEKRGSWVVNTNNSRLIWNWSLEDPVDRNRVHKITLGLESIHRFFKNPSELEKVGKIAYQAGPEDDWQKSIAMQVAIKATGKVYHAPLPEVLYARTSAGG